MGMFDNNNSIEPGTPQKATKRQVEDVPIRAMTGAEIAGSMQRSARSDTAPVRETAAPKAAAVPKDDPVAKQHGLYVTEKRDTKVYFSDYQQKSEVMRASDTKITTKLDDRQTVAAMLDLAKERGWETLKLRGSKEFKQEAWVQAQTLGLRTEGYAPTATDQQEAARRTTSAKAVDIKVNAEAPSAQGAPSERVVTRAGAMAFATPSPTEGAKAGQTPTAPLKVASADAPAKASTAWNAMEKVGREERKVAASATAEAPRPRAAATA